MATKPVLKRSAAALLALAVGAAVLVPTGAAAQERDQRGPQRAERPAMPSMPRAPERSAPTQAPAWQNRSPATSPQPSWGGRPTFAQGSQAPQPARQPANPANPANGWNSRPAWQVGSADRERGDRGNGASAIGQAGSGQPGYGRPTYAQGSQAAQPVRPSWTRVDPNLGAPARGNGGRPGDTVDHTNDHTASWSKDSQGRWYRDSGWQWRQDKGGQWYRDHDASWGRDNSGRWYRNGGGANTGRDNRGWNNNGWNNNGWGYNNGYNSGWRSWDRDGWRRDNRYDWYGWRGRHRNTFSLGIYYAPWQDYSYSRLGIGVTLGAPFYDERYWITDPYAYRLPPAYGPYRWVRYYDDALLVDIYSGEVVDVIYDIFW